MPLRRIWLVVTVCLLAPLSGCVEIPVAEQDAAAGSGPSLSVEDAFEVAQAIVHAGLGGFSILQISHSDEDIDSCRLIRTVVYEVELKSTGEIFEIVSVQNATNAQNCWNKDKFVSIVARGNITRVLQLSKSVGGDQHQVEMAVDEFLQRVAGIAQEHIRLIATKYSYRFGEGDDPESDIELIEFHIRLMSGDDEFLVSTEAAIGFHGSFPVEPRTKPFPPKVLLSLLGGGSYARMRRLN